MNRHLVTPARATSTLAAMALPLTLVLAPPASAGTTVPATVTPVAVDDTEGDIGSWSVAATGTDTWTVSWRAPERLPVAADRPVIVAAEDVGGVEAGTPLGVPTVAEDGRTVEVAVTSTEEPAPDALDVVLSGEVLDEGVPVSSADPGTDRWTEPVRDLLPVDPGVAGDLPTVTSDYELPGIQVPRMAEDVEMVGHVVEPAPEAADSTHPLVLFLHGRHSYCYNPATDRLGWRWPCAGKQEPIPSQLGYDYIQRTLASQGYVTVSIAANGINAQDGNVADGGAAARSQLVQAHLDQWAAWATAGEHEVDLDNVVLVGHSRGGEGVSRASLEIPLTAPYRIAGQVLIGPTNFGRQTTPYVPTVTVLPSCDGDVIDLQGQGYTDLALGLATDDTAMKSSILVVGANHNFFNTEWTPGIAAAPAFDDWGGRGGVCGKGTETRLTAAEQRRVGKAYVAGAVHLFAAGEQDYRPMFDGSAVRVASTGPAVVLSHMVGGDREFRVPGEDATLTTPVGAATVLCEGTTPFGRTRKVLCGKYVHSPEATPHWPVADSLMPIDQAFQLSWEASGGTGGLALDTPLDLTGTDWLDLRTVVDPKVGDVSLQVRITDEAGASVVVDPASGDVLPALPQGDRFSPGKYWAQTLRVETADLAGIDLSKVTEVELVGLSGRGRLWVLDLAAVDAPLPAVPAKRVPIVDLGRVRVDEGGPGTHVAELPFTVTGDVAAPAELWLYELNSTGEPVRLEVDLPAGSDDGTIAWEYEGNNRDSFTRTFHDLVGHAIHNVMLRDNQGRVIVVDDDPAPTVSFRAVHPRAEEGGPAVYEATLSAPTDFEMGVGLYAVPGDGSAAPVHASDMTVRWLKSWTSWNGHDDPALHKLEVNVWGWFSPGETTHRFEIPIRDDARTEPRESLTMRASVETGWHSAPTTVYVPASD
jgi:hypothetical protein